MSYHSIDPTDIVGKDFGKLHVISYDRKVLKIYPNGTKHYNYYYKCQCNCENKTIFYAIRQDLLKGDTKSCGCLKHEFTKNAFKTHGMTNTKFYKTWTHMKARCDYENNNRYKNYGGRGITYDPKWDNFEGFYEDMYESYCKHVEEYGERNTTIDRINVDGNYCKENCRWATYEEQANNRSNTKYIYYDNKKLTLRDIYNNYNHNETVTYDIFRSREFIGWDIDKALSTPINESNRYFYNNDYLSLPELIKKYGEEGIYINLILSRLRNDENNKYHYEDHIFNPKIFQKDLSKPYYPIRIIDPNKQ